MKKHLQECVGEYSGQMDSTHSARSILLLGMPGAGKGTQGNILANLWSVPQISTGELLRMNVAQRTDIGRAAQEVMNRGELVPDSMINEMVKTRLTDRDTNRGFILDGFPRTLDQAAWLTEWFSSQRPSTSPMAVHIHVERRRLIRRVTGRRYCPECQAIFNVHFRPPKKEGFCDRDQAALIQRADDSEEVLRKRLEAYDRLTMPVVEYYRSNNNLIQVEGDGDISQITGRIVELLEYL